VVLRVICEYEQSWQSINVHETFLRDPSGKHCGKEIGYEWVGDRSARWDILIEQPQLWWPIGQGGQPRYNLELIKAGKGPAYSIGLRTVELDTSPDDIGRKFAIKINGKAIYCKGFNWIPDDCFLDRACDPGRVRKRIQQAVDAGANMLRVWGGGIYETDEFYRICDELGVMVWQDFPFACAMYPEEEPFWSEVEAEARENVARLSHHPSLVLWNGCNENIWAYRDWGWKDDPDVVGKTWGKGYYLDLLPRIVRELDPARPYWAASPWSGDEDVDDGVPPNADTHGNMHCWRPWFHDHFTTYRDFAPRFCSEFGFQGPATYASINRVVPREQQDFGHPAMRNRQKSGDRVRDDGDRRNLRALVRQFNVEGAQELLDALAPPDPNEKPPPWGTQPLHPANVRPSRANFDDLHYVLQLTQARALTLAVEWLRSRYPRNMGVLYWQLNDCWPGVTSWSCIDGDGRPKLLWYATRRFYDDVLWTFQPGKDGIFLCIHNDSDKPRDASVNITRRRFDGTIVAEQRAQRVVMPRSAERIPVEPHVARPDYPAAELLVADHHPHALWFFLPDCELRYTEPQLSAARDAGRLTVTAGSFIRDLCINIDRLDPQATVSDQLITLLPGESFTFDIQSERSLTVEQLTMRPVLQCANWYGLSAAGPA
jgi:beta-mannosidase